MFLTSMTTLVFIFGVLGNITTGLVYLSPIKTFWRIAKKRSTEDFESIPYTCKLLNAYQWVYYGIIKPNSILVATVNAFGGAAELVYIVIFLAFPSSPRIRAKAAIEVGILDLAFPIAEFLSLQFLLKGETRINVSGLMCIVFSMATYASPLSAMKMVITSKSVEFMPFFLSFSLFINGGVWTTYAFLTNDWFIGVPNGTGFLLGSAQLVLYAIYCDCGPFKRKLGSTRSEEDRQGQQQYEPLIPSSPPPVDGTSLGLID